MFNPDEQERRLSKVDTKVQRKTIALTIVISLAVVAGVFAAGELVFRAISAFLKR